MLELLVVIGAIVVAIIGLAIAISLAIVLGVIAFLAYVISDVTGISFPVLFLILAVAAVVWFLSS